MQYKYSTKSLNKQNQKKIPYKTLHHFETNKYQKKNKIQTIILKLHYLQNIPNTHYQTSKNTNPT